MTMKLAARFAIAVLVSAGPMTYGRQDAGSSPDSSSQNRPAASEKAQNATGEGATSKANQGQNERQSSKENSVGAEKPAATKSLAHNPSSAARKHRSPSHKPADPPAGTEEPRKIVVHRGGVREPVAQIIPGMSVEEARRQRQESEDLLVAADSDLKKLVDRNLNSNQQETVSQIRHFMEVARTALQDGDVRRAHTLAQKAQLLSDDLVKH